jgi:hypothetical protein
MPFVLRQPTDTSNPTLAWVFGQQSTRGLLVYWEREGSRTKALYLLSQGGKYGCDGMDEVRYNGHVIDRLDRSSNPQWVFHPGTQTTGWDDPLQGRPAFFPNLDFAFNGKCYIEVIIPADIGPTDATTDPTEAEFFMRGLVVEDYTLTGGRLQEAGPVFSANNMLVGIYTLREKGLIPLRRFQKFAADWWNFKLDCDATITWDKGADAGGVVSIPRFDAHISYASSQTPQAAFASVLMRAPGWLLQDVNGGLRPVRLDAAPVHTVQYDADEPGVISNMLRNGTAGTPKDPADLYNFFIFTYRDLDDPLYLEKQVFIDRAPLRDAAGGVLNILGPIALPGVMRQSLAERIGNYIARQTSGWETEADPTVTVYPLQFEVKAKADAYHVAKNDNILLVNSRFGAPTGDPFRCRVIKETFNSNAGERTFTVQVTDEHLVRDTDHSVVQGAGSSPVLSTLSPLPDGITGNLYDLTITAAGGQAPYSYSVPAGTLPTGLTLETSGRLHGTPTSPATSTFTVTVTDALGQTATLSYTVTIYTPSSFIGGSSGDGSNATYYKGITSPTGTEFSYLAGVTSALQGQLDNRLRVDTAAQGLTPTQKDNARTNLGLAAADSPTFAGATLSKTDAVTSALTDVLTVAHNSSGTPATNFGGSVLFNLKSSTTVDRNAVRAGALWVTATDASRTSAFTLQTVDNAGALTERLRVSKTLSYLVSDETRIGSSVNAGGVGNSSRLFVFGGSSGANIDVMGDGTVADQATLELEGSDYSTTFKSIRLQYYGVNGTGTTFSLSNVNLGALIWQENTVALMGTTNTVPVRVFYNSSEAMRLGAGLAVGTVTDPGAGLINVLTGFRIGNAAASGNVLRGNGTNFVSSALATTDLSGAAALTKVDDTNITLTLGGTPATALLRAASITVGWSGTLALTRGGTAADLSATGGTSQVLRQSSSGAAITVSQLAASDLSNGLTGSGLVVLQTFPTLITPVLGVATATSINKVALTAPASAATLTIANNKTLTVSNSLTLAGTDGKSLTLTGGLTIGADTSITGGGTLALGGFTFTVPATGTAVLTSRTITEGAGLAGNTYDLSADRTLALGTPSTLTVSSTNSASGTTHSHAITSSSNPGAAASLLASTSAGLLTLVNLLATSNLYVRDSSTGFTSAGTTVVSPIANNLFQSTSYTSGLTGWSINAIGDIEANNITLRGALRSSILLYNQVMTTAGSQLITPSAGKLKTDVIVPASPTYGTTTVTIEIVDQDGVSHATSQLFAVNDILYIKDGLVGYTYFKVTAVSDQTTFWRYTASIQAGTNSITYHAGLGVIDYKQAGAGAILLTADAANAPYLQMYTHAATFSSADASGTLVITPQLRLGNLNGSYGYAADVYGLGAGQYGTASKTWVTVEQTNGFRVGNNTTTLGQWDTSGNIQVGDTTASAGNVKITSGGQVQIRRGTTNYITLDATDAQFTNLIKMSGSSAAIALGSTPPTSASAGTGIWLDRTGLFGLNANTVNFKIDATNGNITAIAGTIGGWTINAASLSSGGITLAASATAASNKIYVGTGTYNNSNTAFYVDGSGQFSLKDKLTWDGTTLTVTGGGTFSGALSAATGTFIGALSAATGTFAGSLTAGSGTISGDLNIGTGGELRSGATAVLTADGYWLDYNAGTPRFRIGTITTGALTKGLYWDGSNLQIKGTNFTLDSSGNLTASGATLTSVSALSGSITGTLTMSGSSAAITIGSTAPTDATHGTGIWLDRTGMYGLASNVLQAKFDAVTGKITAGAGDVAIDVNGIGITATANAAASRSVNWLSGSTVVSSIYGLVYGIVSSHNASVTNITATGLTSSDNANIILTSTVGTNTAIFSLQQTGNVAAWGRGAWLYGTNFNGLVIGASESSGPNAMLDVRGTATITGNTGIGVTVASNRLHVYSTGSTDGISLDGTTFPAFVLRSSGTIVGYAPAVVTTATGFFTNSLIGDICYRSEVNRILLGVGSGASTMIISTGVQIGAPTGGDKGAGTLNLAGDIYKNNTAYTNPDFVLEHWATGKIEKFAGKEGAADYKGLMPLSELRTFTRKNFHLPRFGQRAGHGYLGGGEALLATVEEQQLYIFQLEDRIKLLEERFAT